MHGVQDEGLEVVESQSKASAGTAQVLIGPAVVVAIAAACMAKNSVHLLPILWWTPKQKTVLLCEQLSMNCQIVWYGTYVTYMFNKYRKFLILTTGTIPITVISYHQV